MRSAKQAYSGVKPYVHRAVSDDEVKDNLKDAFYAARDIYDELFGGRSPVALAQRVATDGEIHDNLKKISDDLRSAVERVQGKHEHRGRNFFMLLTGVAIGVLSALGAAVRPLGAGTAGVETIFFLLIVSGRALGPGFGFSLGCTTLFASALITSGVGPWMPYQMFACAWIGLGAGLLPKATGRREIALEPEGEEHVRRVGVAARARRPARCAEALEIE